MENDVIVIWFAMNNHIANNLRISDEDDPKLRGLIDETLEFVVKEGEEIYDQGHTYLITEKGIYLACYKEEIENFEELPNEIDEKY